MSVNLLRNSVRVTHEHATIHAEIAALRKLKPGKHVTVYVARINNQGYPRMSKPCDKCLEYLIACNVDEVVYSTEDGFVVEKI